jgi:asparagine synthase (glutamine-hydrolysing)
MLNKLVKRRLPTCIDKLNYTTMRFYLVNDVLVKVDRASMAHGLEVRSPFMDYRIVEFLLSLPLSYKLKGMQTKYILRHAFRDALPPTPVKRQKHGFAVPVGEWFKGTLGNMMRDMLLSKDMEGFIDTSYATSIMDEHQRAEKDHGHRLWLILILGMWKMWWKNSD